MEKNQENLKILVVEDAQRHQMAAEYYLKPHTVKVVSTFNKAHEYLRQNEDIDVVLSDMFFPYGKGCPSPDDSWEENPLGYAVALYAARRNVPRIAILTDCNHHSNAVAGTFDAFYRSSADFPNETCLETGSHYDRLSYGSRPFFKINNSYFCMFDERDLGYCKDLVVFDKSKSTVVPYIGSEETEEKRTEGDNFLKVKKWGNALERMLSLK